MHIIDSPIISSKTPLYSNTHVGINDYVDYLTLTCPEQNQKQTTHNNTLEINLTKELIKSSTMVSNICQINQQTVKHFYLNFYTNLL